MGSQEPMEPMPTEPLNIKTLGTGMFSSSTADQFKAQLDAFLSWLSGVWLFLHHLSQVTWHFYECLDQSANCVNVEKN